MRRREAWVGNAERFGILQRIGIGGFLISFALVCLFFDMPGGALIRYEVFIAAHALLYAGFILAAVADVVAERRFSLRWVLYSAFMGILYCVLGPIAMSAAAAANRV